MKQKSEHKGRTTNSFSRIRAIALIIAKYLLIPTFTVGCSPSGFVVSMEEEHTDYFPIQLKAAEAQMIRHSDIFIFNDDELGRIDSYSRSERVTEIKAASREGRKRIVVISNSSKPKEYWRKIRSHEGLMQEISLLSDDDSGFPLMSGSRTVDAGTVSRCDIRLSRIMSEIYINSICSDFRGTEYETEVLSEVKFYLTNVNSSCEIMREKAFRMEMPLNQGYFDEKAVAGFRDREMLYRELPFDISSETKFPDISLYCYPNDSWDESAGSAHTTLVIEGKLRGKTYYYPIDINHLDMGVAFGGDKEGIRRNCKYIFDICICRTGTSSADIRLDKKDVSVSCRIKDWEDKEENIIEF